MNIAATVVALFSWASIAGVQSQMDEQRRKRITLALDSVRERLIDIRRDLHRHPELSGEEERSANLVAKELRELDFKVRTGVGGHGVVARLQGAGPGPVVAFRADMDAVATDSPDPVSFSSVRPGIRHICGHDIHTTVGLAVAHSIHAIREEWSGTIVLIFQPAEETGRGALAMIADGVFEDLAPDALFAFHSSPLPVGTIGVTPGQGLARRDRVQAVLSGPGDLPAAAREVSEAISALTTLKTEVRSVTEDFIVASVSSSRRDGDRWIVTAQITTSGKDASRKAKEKLSSFQVSMPAKVSFELSYERALSGIFNDPEILKSSKKSVLSVVGDEGFREILDKSPEFSEDFGFLQEHSPGVMYWLGVSNPSRSIVGMPHSPDFAADEEAIFWGAKVMTTVLLDHLAR